MNKKPLVIGAIILAGGISIIGWWLAKPGSSGVETGTLKPKANKAEKQTGSGLNAPNVRPQPPRLPRPEDGIINPSPVVEAGAPTRAATPNLQELIPQQIKAEMKVLYADVFASLQLSPEKQDRLAQILAERVMNRSEMGMNLSDEEVPAEEKTKIVAENVIASKASDEAISALIGNDADYKKFQFHEETLPDRIQFKRMGGMAHFESAGEPLSTEQQEKLINAMYSARNSIGTQQNKDEGITVDESMRALLQRQDQSFQATAAQAAEFLTPAQLEALTLMQQQVRSSLEGGLQGVSSAMQITQ